MELVRVFLLFLVQFYLNTVSAEEWLKFTRARVLDGNMCPDANVIKKVQNAVRTECLNLCSEHLNCTGAFLQQVNKHCVLCSAKYLSRSTENSTAGYEFYKRYGHSIGDGAVRIYWLVEGKLAWNSSKEACELDGGQLASIKTSEDSSFIMKTVVAGSGNSVWTSGTGLGGMASTFVWNDGSLVEDGYTNWNSGQPSSKDPGTFACMALAYSFKFRWDDADCTWKRNALCVFK